MTTGAFNWINEAVAVLKNVEAGSPEDLKKIDELLSGVPVPPQDLGFNSPADRYARAWHALEAGRHEYVDGRNATIEECATICDRKGMDSTVEMFGVAMRLAATAIRNLKRRDD